MPPQFLMPDWPAPASVRATCTLRSGGISEGPYASFNLGAHVGDDAAHVDENRRRLRTALTLPGEPLWLNQVHGCEVVAGSLPAGSAPTADAAHGRSEGEICAVLTADCLPVLFCNRQGTQVAAAHAGWRGLAAGVLDRTIDAFRQFPDELIAWMGPAIGPQSFEVGEEVRTAFLNIDAGNAECFRSNRPGHWLADLYGLARRALQRRGLRQVYGGGWCTYAEPDRFFSFRRERATGRMASLIWITSE